MVSRKTFISIFRFVLPNLDMSIWNMRPWLVYKAGLSQVQERSWMLALIHSFQVNPNKRNGWRSTYTLSQDSLSFSSALFYESHSGWQWAFDVQQSSDMLIQHIHTDWSFFICPLFVFIKDSSELLTFNKRWHLICITCTYNMSLVSGKVA